MIRLRKDVNKHDSVAIIHSKSPLRVTRPSVLMHDEGCSKIYINVILFTQSVRITKSWGVKNN